jgi:hypothetical protein
MDDRTPRRKIYVHNGIVAGDIGSVEVTGAPRTTTYLHRGVVVAGDIDSVDFTIGSATTAVSPVVDHDDAGVIVGTGVVVAGKIGHATFSIGAPGK